MKKTLLKAIIALILALVIGTLAVPTTTFAKSKSSSGIAAEKKKCLKYQKHLKKTYPVIIDGPWDNFVEYVQKGKKSVFNVNCTARQITPDTDEATKSSTIANLKKTAEKEYKLAKKKYKIKRPVFNFSFHYKDGSTMYEFKKGK